MVEKRSAEQMYTLLAADPERIAKLKNDPKPVLAEARDEAIKSTPPAYIGDRFIYRFALITMAVIMIGFGTALVLLPTTSDAVQSGFLLSLGALVGLFGGRTTS